MKKSVSSKIISIFLILTLFFCSGYFLLLNEQPLARVASANFQSDIDTNINENESSPSEVIPKQFNNDPYNLPSYITPVKNQHSYGMCWAFAICSVAESDAIKNHNANINTNFSEWHLANFTYNGERYNTNGDNVQILNNSDTFYNLGSIDPISILSLSSGIGFLDESQASYQELMSSQNKMLNNDLIFQNSGYVLKNAYIYEMPKQIEEVKKAIMKYGSITTCYSHSNSHNNYLTSAIYCDIDTPSDHEVTLVGWDDNYSKNNFSVGHRPKNNGAWLMKNSWGMNSGINGFYWISFEDKSIKTATAYDVMPSNSYDNFYQYDGGISFNYRYNTENHPVANVFKASKNEILSAIGIYTSESDQNAYSDAYQDYELRIYKNLNDNFSVDSLALTQKGKFGCVGYEVIDLKAPIELEKDENYVVWLKTNAKIGVDTTTTLNFSSGGCVQSTANIAPKQSYYTQLQDGQELWFDTFDNSKKFNFRIKAYTKNQTNGKAILDLAPTLKSVYYGQKLQDSQIFAGRVVDSISGKIINGEWKFKNKSYMPSNNNELIELIFYPSNSKYKEVECKVAIELKKVAPNITITNLDNEYAINQIVKFDYEIKNPYNNELNEFNQIKFYYQINENLKNEIINKSFKLPNDLQRDSKLYIIAESVENDYYLSTTKTIVCDIVFDSVLSTQVFASEIYFGQTLKDCIISGGKVVDKLTKNEILGEWEFKDINQNITKTGKFILEFKPYNSNYEKITKEIIVNVLETKLHVDFDIPKKDFVNGEKIDINALIKNPYNNEVYEGDVVVSYRIGEKGKIIETDEKSFKIPKEAVNKKLYIFVTAQNINGEYITTTKSIDVNVHLNLKVFYIILYVIIGFVVLSILVSVVCQKIRRKKYKQLMKY